MNVTVILSLIAVACGMVPSGSGAPQDPNKGDAATGPINTGWNSLLDALKNRKNGLLDKVHKYFRDAVAKITDISPLGAIPKLTEFLTDLRDAQDCTLRVLFSFTYLNPVTVIQHIEECVAARSAARKDPKVDPHDAIKESKQASGKVN